MRRSHKQNGFTLMELMVVMGIMLIVMAATMSLLRDSLKASNVTHELTDAQESLRAAQEYINRDLMSAGNGLNGIGTFQIAPAFISNYLTTNSASGFSMIASDDNVAVGTNVLGTSPAVTIRSSPNRTDRITILGLDQNDPSMSYLPVSLPGGSTITMSGTNATVTVSATAYNNAVVGEIYCFTSGTKVTFGVVTGKTTSNRLQFTTGDTYGLNDGSIGTITGNGAQAASLTRMKIIHYFVDSNGLLIRRVFGVTGKAFNDDVIAEHVVDLQFRYLTNESTSSGVQRQAVTQLTTATQQVAVREVETTVTTETTHAILNGGGKQQLTMTGLTAIRNMQFRNVQQ